MPLRFPPGPHSGPPLPSSPAQNTPELASGPAPEGASATPALPTLAVVIPTYNERDNIPELIARLESALVGAAYELLFVDDDSPDGTAATITRYARRDPRIRLLQRIGRRGLSTACIEGILATTSSYVAVMDADMQHDETVLPLMLRRAHAESLDLVVGTRNAQGGSMGEFCQSRQFLSHLGHRFSQTVCQCSVSDPMSGFFLLNRAFFLENVHALHGGGFKILVDLLSSAERPVRFAEVGYTFRLRRHGESKLDVSTAIEYLFLLLHKATRGAIPTRFAAFSLVGTVGVTVHLLCLAALLLGPHLRFLPAQILATYVAMVANFFLNNLITWRDCRLRGLRLLSGLLSFCLVCSFGAWANAVFARALLGSGSRWYLAGAAGVLISSVWNYSMANLFTWQPHRRAEPSAVPDQAPADRPLTAVKLDR